MEGPLQFANRLIVSCQDMPGWTIPQAVAGGCGGLRVNGPEDVELAWRHAAGLPIIACWKDESGRITPDVAMAEQLVRAQADAVAFDASDTRESGVSVEEMICAIHKAGAFAFADIATLAEGMAATKAGADFIGSTLAGELSYGLISHLRKACEGAQIVAEGLVRTPESAYLSVEHGAHLVVVGAAITKPKMITEWFVEALK